MSALRHTHPPPLPNKLCVTSKNDEELAELTQYLTEHESARFPKFQLDTGKLIIIFKAAPDTAIQRLIETDVHRICNDAELTWEVTNYEDALHI